MTGGETRRIHFDKGYRGHKEKFRVWISGQVRRVTASIRREMKRRATVEPVIGHTKAEHRMNRNYPKGRDGDRINAVLAAAGYNFALLLRWLARLLCALLQALFTALPDPRPGLKTAAQRFFTTDSAGSAHTALSAPAGASAHPNSDNIGEALFGFAKTADSKPEQKCRNAKPSREPG